MPAEQKEFKPCGIVLFCRGAFFIFWRRMKKKEVLHKVVTFLDRKELDFLDRICKDIYFSKNIKIPRSTVLKEFIDLFNSDRVQKVKNYQDLVTEILRGYGA